MPAYETFPSGAWIQPTETGYKMMCCDCGLVHKMNFQIVVYGKGEDGEAETIVLPPKSFLHIQFQAERDTRATGQARRWRKKKGLK